MEPFRFENGCGFPFWLKDMHGFYLNESMWSNVFYYDTKDKLFLLPYKHFHPKLLVWEELTKPLCINIILNLAGHFTWDNTKHQHIKCKCKN